MTIDLPGWLPPILVHLAFGYAAISVLIESWGNFRSLRSGESDRWWRKALDVGGLIGGVTIAVVLSILAYSTR